MDQVLYYIETLFQTCHILNRNTFSNLLTRNSNLDSKKLTDDCHLQETFGRLEYAIRYIVVLQYI